MQVKDGGEELLCLQGLEQKNKPRQSGRLLLENN